jgi:hypothetical protein
VVGDEELYGFAISNSISMSNQEELSEEVVGRLLKTANPFTILQMVWALIKSFIKEKPEIIMLTSIILIMLWGYHGNLDLLKYMVKDWSPPGEATATRSPILPWVVWDRELISFLSGALLLVCIPALIIHFGFKQYLRDYGLGLPSREKRLVGMMLFITLILISLYPFYIAAKDGDMQMVYPFYKHFSSISQFILFELCYFPFFLAIEFIFRGYLLLGLSFNLHVKYSNHSGKNTSYTVGKSAIAISMLSYTAWHLGKPLTELWGTPFWGLIAGAGTYYVRSIWPALMAHFLLNVFLDGMILYNLHIFPLKY